MNSRRDYVEKRNQYEWRGIPEYWILAPIKSQVSGLALTEGEYEERVFMGDEIIQSATFLDWTLTATEMLAA